MSSLECQASVCVAQLGGVLEFFFFLSFFKLWCMFLFHSVRKVLVSLTLFKPAANVMCVICSFTNLNHAVVFLLVSSNFRCGSVVNILFVQCFVDS